MTSASTFVSLIEKTGAHQVATKKPDMSNDVAHTVASAFIVPMDSPVRTLAGFARPFSRARALTAG